MRTTHMWTDDSATIAVEGLVGPVRLLHVTDSHLALIDARDAGHVEACSGVRERFGQQRLDADGNGIFTEITFAELMSAAAALDADLLAHTGDLIHFPSQANMEAAMAGLGSARSEVLFTSGNHDWLFPGGDSVPGHREASWPRLDPLTDGRPSHQARDIGGLRFVAVDDSTYQIGDGQLAFWREQLAAGLPTVLFTHIPLSLPTLRPPTIARWQSPLLLAEPAWPAGERELHGIGEDTAATVEFARSLTAAENLVAVFCGHVHFPHVDTLSPSAAQYVGAPGFMAGQRLVEFQPLD